MTDIARWLEGLGLGKYASAFADAEVDLVAVPHLTDDDLKELGLPIGPRRKVLAAAAIAVTNGLRPSLGPAVPPARRSEAERRQLTVTFCDLVGSTALASRLDPEDLREVLGAYHATVAAVVTEFGGYVAKYMGDGVLAYFGYPQAHEHDAEQAVRAGLALIDRVGRLESGAVALASRVGIATGLVVVGDLVGSGDALERAVVGETPNLAARLQEMAPANAVLVAESTRRLVGDLFDYRDLGAVPIKGLNEPIPAAQVLSESTVESRFEALRSATLSPLVGRDEEVQLLLRRWVQAKAGEGQVVLISGEAGIGKSRVAAALQGHLAAERPVRLRYFCSPHRSNSALFPVVAQLERAAGLARGDSPAVKLDKLAVLLSGSSDDIEETAAVIADLLAIPTNGRYGPLAEDPRQKRERIFAVLIRQLEETARRRPLLFLFEDVHWIDSTSLELLDRIVERVRQLPVLLVLTFRPEFEPPWTGQAEVTSLTLNRLGQRETRALAGRVAGGKALPGEIVDRIIEHSDGIPLSIEEMTKTLLEGPLLREENGRYILSGPLPSLAIPSSLHDSLMARLDRLGPIKDVAQIGAAIGREFSYDIVKAVTALPDEQLDNELDQLVGAGLIFRRAAPPQASFVFKHALVQDAAYGTLLRGRRQELHSAIAKVLEELIVPSRNNETSVGERAALLAHHWLRAEDWDKALGYTLEAAERAQKLYARREAINHHWHALDLIERLPHTPERSQIHCDIIVSLVSLPGWMRDEEAEARLFRHVDQALAGATAAGQSVNMAKMEAIKGRHEDDEALIEGAIARAARSGDRLTEAWIAGNYGDYLGTLGRFKESLVHVAHGIDLLGAEGQQAHQARAMVIGGRCYNARAGKLDQALAFAGHARSVANELNEPQLKAWCAMEAEPLFYRGLWQEAAMVAEEALPMAWDIREWTVVYFSSAWLTLACLKLGEPEKAQRVLDRLSSEAPAYQYKASAHGIQYAQVARAELQLTMGHYNEALSTAHHALTLSERHHFRLEEVAAHRVLGKIHAAMGDRALAEAAFRRSLDVLDNIQCPPELAQTLLAYGYFRRGDNTQEDRVLIGRALSLFEAMRATGWIEEARVALAAASPV